MLRKLIKYLFLSGFLLGVLGATAGGLVGWFYYNRLTRDLPRIEKLSDYRPKAVSSIYADDGTLLGEVYEERRYPVRLDEIPLMIRQAFLAAEDANFYSHPGVDVISILRAIYVNFRSGSARQGASTITQQVVKSLLLTREKKFERKVKEAILSYRLEKALSKDDILSIYLNEIFFGHSAYGVKAAAKVHFHKELKDVTVAEAAFLASLPQRPSELINPKNRKHAIRRQGYVLKQMLENKMITEAQYEEAKAEKLTVYPPETDTVFHAPYFYSHALQVAEEELQRINRRLSLKHPGGFTIRTTGNVRANELAERSLQRGLREVDKRRGWRGPVKKIDQAVLEAQAKKGIREFSTYYAKVVKILRPGVFEVRVGDFQGVLDVTKATWAKRYLDDHDDASGVDPSRMIQLGAVVEVSLEDRLNDKKEVMPPADPAKDRLITDPTEAIAFKLDQTPEVEGAFAALNPRSGKVVAIVGGYDYRKSVFNRATQGMLQPGSSFKPFIYTAAVDKLNYTPSTIVPDSPISMVAGNGKIWAPANFDGKFLGPITLRTALQRSRNVVSVYLLQQLGVDRGIEYARKFGLTTPIDRNMSIALGTPEVKLIEMVRGYGVFAAEGYLADSIVISSIVDRNGNEILKQEPKQKRVLDENTAFVMANMMKGVVERGTATVIKKLGRPAAGKTGTTNEHMDAWFIGYTPEWAAGTWVGFDVKRPMGKVETGGKAAAPVFLYFMEEFLKGSPVYDFDIPDGVIPVSVDLESGHPVADGFVEYFKAGTEPSSAHSQPKPSEEAEPKDYLSNSEL